MIKKFLFSRRFAAWSVFSIVAALPLILVLFYGAEILTSGSESLAYRFFYSYRVLNGEVGGGHLWFPQGYLVSAFQNLLLVVSGADSASGGELRAAFNLFCRGTMAFNTLVMIGGGALVCFVRGVTWTDRILFAIVALAPIFATSGQGFQHSLWPDYYHLNVALCAVGVAFFQVAWRRPDLASPLGMVFAAGLFAGLAVANKITAGVCGAALLLLVVLRPGAGLGGWLGRGALATAGVVIGAVLPVVAFYGLDFGAADAAFQSWWAFMQKPGGDVGFAAQVVSYLTNNHLGAFGLFFVVAVILAVIAAFRRRDDSARFRIILLSLLLVAGALVYSVIQRPAGTSLFEAAVFVGGFAAVLLTMVPSSVTRHVAVGLFALGFLGLSTFSFPWKNQLRSLAFSKVEADARWKTYQWAVDHNDGRRIVFFIPDNSYHAQDLFIILLKGTAEMLSWNVSPAARPTLDRFLPGIVYRTMQSTAPPDDPNDEIYIWNDTKGREPVASFFPDLAAAIADHPGEVPSIYLESAQDFKYLEVSKGAPSPK